MSHDQLKTSSTLIRFFARIRRMKLRGVDFGLVWGGSGVQGFVGEGYWWSFLYRRYLARNITFVSKTVTLGPHTGNVRLRDDFKPRKIFPETLQMNFFTGQVTNKFGWANPGLEKILETSQWQSRTEPFFISIGSLGETTSNRLDDFREIVQMLEKETFLVPYGLQLNISCPNLDKAEPMSVPEIQKTIEILSTLQVPLIIKLGPTEPLETFVKLENTPGLDGYCFSNTLSSPAGGISGTPLLERNIEFIKRLREAGVRKPINAGGGILSQNDAQRYLDAGAQSVFFWSLTLLRPWRIPSLLKIR